MSPKLYFNITGGPSRHQLVDALKYAFDKETPHQATFRTKESDEHHFNNGQNSSLSDISRSMTIACLEYEDGSGNSFFFKGIMPIPISGSSCSVLYDVRGVYNTKTNKGYIKTE